MKTSNAMTQKWGHERGQIVNESINALLADGDVQTVTQVSGTGA